MTLDRFAGKYVVVCCFGSSQIRPGHAALDAMRRHKADFDDVKTCFLGVAVDHREQVESQLQNGIYYYLDKDGSMSRQCGAAPREAVPLGTQYRVTWTIVDPSMHVLAHFHTSEEGADCEAVFSAASRSWTYSDHAKSRRHYWFLRVCLIPTSAIHWSNFIKQASRAIAVSCVTTWKYSIIRSNAVAIFSSTTKP
jgi:hypothetical protein